MTTLATVDGAALAPGAAVRLDGHAHAWIDPPADVAPSAALPLRDEPHQRAALARFAEAAGTQRAALIDCQPPACGRDARMLARLSRATGVAISACTGFHLAQYYPGGVRPWSDAASAAEHFSRELGVGLHELPTRRAGLIKAAHTGRSGEDPSMWDAVVEARGRTDALLLVHTERGASVEALLDDLLDRNVPARKVYLCHVDKRPDLDLHLELARAGVLLGFDTLVRPRYRPEETTWPLLARLVEEGHGTAIALGLDLAEAAMWHGHGPTSGPAALVHHVERELVDRGYEVALIDALLGQNLLRRATDASSGAATTPATPTSPTAADAPRTSTTPPADTAP